MSYKSTNAKVITNLIRNLVERENMKILITGIAGFIGSNIGEKLAEDHTIIGIDNLSNGKKNNVENSKIEFHQLDILDLNALQKICKGIDIILHQAALASVTRSVKDPMATTQANIIGTLNVLLAARDSGVKRVVLASSSSVYGDTPTLPKKEDMGLNPLSPYALSKMANEIHAKQFYDLYGLETVCLRYFNVFGPKQNPNSEYAAVIPKFITKILRNEKLVIYGDGMQTRDFSYVEDVIQANSLAMNAPKNACGKVFNIAGGKTITINELVEKINKLLNKKIKPSYDKPRPGDITHSYASIELAKEYLGYKPKYTVEDGLKETVAWFKGRA